MFVLTLGDDVISWSLTEDTPKVEDWEVIVFQADEQERQHLIRTFPHLNRSPFNTQNSSVVLTLKGSAASHAWRIYNDHLNTIQLIAQQRKRLMSDRQQNAEV